MKKKPLFDGKKVTRKKCPVCKGTGELEDSYFNTKTKKSVKIKTKCLICKGTGYEI